MKQIKNQANSDHRCPLKQGNTQSELTFGYNIDEIRGFHSIQSEIPTDIDEIQRFLRISQQILKNDENIWNFRNILTKIQYNK